jgi:hypothetical protein
MHVDDILQMIQHFPEPTGPSVFTVLERGAAPIVIVRPSPNIRTKHPAHEQRQKIRIFVLCLFQNPRIE